MATVNYKIDCVAALPIMAAIEARFEEHNERTSRMALKQSIRSLWRVAVDMLLLK